MLMSNGYDCVKVQAREVGNLQLSYCLMKKIVVLIKYPFRGLNLCLSAFSLTFLI